MKSSQDAYVTSERVGPLHRKHGVWGGEFKDHKGSYEAVTAYIHTLYIHLYTYSQPLNNTGLKHTGPLTRRLFLRTTVQDYTRIFAYDFLNTVFFSVA